MAEKSVRVGSQFEMFKDWRGWKNEQRKIGSQ